MSGCMSWWTRKPRDFVMVLDMSGGWKKCRVEWLQGRAYAERNYEFLRLMPGGKFDAHEEAPWLKKWRWEPASDAMSNFYVSEKT